MKELLLVAIGGALGACGRYALTGLIAGRTAAAKFPLGTFSVNVIGCLAAGIIIGLAEKQRILTPEMKLFLTTGLLGGFTTYSAFGVETASLIKRGDILMAAIYVVATVITALIALWLANAIVKSAG
ncbi:MAG: fluoride efflux transporter CrcB [Fibrobacteres bacterium]|nr:fluoride efflux transporter CrcB [Fibrobacterota bacterium]